MLFAVAKQFMIPAIKGQGSLAHASDISYSIFTSEPIASIISSPYFYNESFAITFIATGSFVFRHLPR